MAPSRASVSTPGLLKAVPSQSWVTKLYCYLSVHTCCTLPPALPTAETPSAVALLPLPCLTILPTACLIHPCLSHTALPSALTRSCPCPVNSPLIRMPRMALCLPCCCFFARLPSCMSQIPAGGLFSCWLLNLQKQVPPVQRKPDFRNRSQQAAKTGSMPLVSARGLFPCVTLDLQAQVGTPAHPCESTTCTNYRHHCRYKHIDHVCQTC